MKTFIRPAEISELDPLISDVTDYLRSLGFSEAFILETELVVEEMFSNTAYYAYPDKDTEGYCRFDVELQNDELMIRRIDEGVPFNPLEKEAPDTTLSYQDRPIGGLGIFLIRHYSTRLDYSYEGNKNILTLYRTLPDKAAERH